MTGFVARFIRDESGVTSIEYALITALISVVAIAAMTVAAQQLLAVYTDVGTDLAGAFGEPMRAVRRRSFISGVVSWAN